MATRLYGVPSTAAPVSPGFGAWTTTAAAVRRSLSTTKSGTAETVAGFSITSGSGNNALAFQLVSDSLNGAQTITGTVTIVTRGRELAGNDNVGARVRTIKVYSSDGATLRGTLLALGNHSVTTELGTTLAGYPAANADALSSVSAQDGDRIVVELGYGMTTTGTTPQADMSIGGTGTDHANAEGDTTGTIPWVEFSQNLTFGAPVTASVAFVSTSALGLGVGHNTYPSTTAEAETSTTPYVMNGSATMAIDTALMHSGAGSLKSTVTAPGNAYVHILESSSYLAAVTARTQYTGTVWVNPSANISGQIIFAWFDSSFNWLGNDAGPESAASSGVWTQYSYTPALSPAGAVWASAGWQATTGSTTGVTFNLDDFAVVGGAQVTRLAAVGLASTSTLTVAGTKQIQLTVTLVSSSTLSVTPLVTHPYAVTLASTSTLGVAVSGFQSATVAFVSTSTLAVVASLTVLVTVAFVSTSTVTAVPLAALPPILVMPARRL